MWKNNLFVHHICEMKQENLYKTYDGFKHCNQLFLSWWRVSDNKNYTHTLKKKKRITEQKEDTKMRKVPPQVLNRGIKKKRFSCPFMLYLTTTQIRPKAKFWHARLKKYTPTHSDVRLYSITNYWKVLPLFQARLWHIWKASLCHSHM
jgi:hypothetical protein